MKNGAWLTKASALVAAGVWLDGGGASCWIPVQDVDAGQGHRSCQQRWCCFIPTILRLLISPISAERYTCPRFMAWNKEAPVKLDHLSKDGRATYLTGECPAEARNQNRGIFFRNIFVTESGSSNM